VCESQKNLYNPVARSEVIYIGVTPPPPLINKYGTVTTDQKGDYAKTIGPILVPTNGCDELEKEPFIFLSLGIICPRKNQIWCAKLFKKLVGDRKDVKLIIVGARYTRSYEIEYVEELKKFIDDDKRIEIHDVTDNVDKFFQVADCLLFTSKNEVTPMVIPEAMSYGIPVLSTNVGGITEMFTDGVEGFMFNVGDDNKAVECAKLMLNNEKKRKEMGKAGLIKYHQKFRMRLMVNNYRNLILKVTFFNYQ
jgi:glycosyltransferase involved in cell wall biosynthesis